MVDCPSIPPIPSTDSEMEIQQEVDDNKPKWKTVTKKRRRNSKKTLTDDTLQNNLSTDTNSDSPSTSKDPKHLFQRPPIMHDPPNPDNLTSQSPDPANNSSATPPIILKDTVNWIQTFKEIEEAKIRTTKCKLNKDSIQINSASETDHRNLIKFLEDKHLQFFTYQLKSERNLKIVIRGIDLHISMEEVAADLDTQGYPILKATRMKGKGNVPIPLVLIEIERKYNSIHELKNCCSLNVTTEPLRLRTDIIQCHKCQRFGHIQRNCRMNYRCMKCGDNHSTHLCKKLKTLPPRCANCKAAHLSTHIRCHLNPNNPAKSPATSRPAPPPTVNAWDARKKTEDEKNSKTTSSHKDEFAKTLGNMLILFSSTNATQEQKLLFLHQTELLIKHSNHD